MAMSCSRYHTDAPGPLPSASSGAAAHPERYSASTSFHDPQDAVAVPNIDLDHQLQRPDLVEFARPQQKQRSRPRLSSRKRNRRQTAALTGLGLTLAGCLATPALAADLENNVTSIEGTWSSGAGQVSTGLSFFNPMTFEFTVPSAGGISYSFTDDGHWEQSKYIFATDSTHNQCVNATLLWQHGTYTFNSNGSISLSPFPSDGHILTVDMCGGKTVHEDWYTQFELIPAWYMYLESNTGFGSNISADYSAYALQMYQDGGEGKAGAAMAPLYLRARPPVMLPTQQLHEPVLNT